MKRISVAAILAPIAFVLGTAHAPGAMAEAYGLPPDERAQLRQQLRDAHRQRMLEHHGLTFPAAAPAAAPRGGTLPRLSPEEREALRHQLREQRRAARPHWHPEHAIQGPEAAGTQRHSVTGPHPSVVGRRPEGGAQGRSISVEAPR